MNEKEANTSLIRLFSCSSITEMENKSSVLSKFLFWIFGLLLLLLPLSSTIDVTNQLEFDCQRGKILPQYNFAAASTSIQSNQNDDEDDDDDEDDSRDRCRVHLKTNIFSSDELPSILVWFAMLFS